ncbi:MAG: anaerobic ribonucleoside triphosphate reductase, partial [Bacilli bacterium]|nr:anaerobic ribonucleoside triphosphate reductase [Bacilli bacterium]
MTKFIIKRDGRKTKFDSQKIFVAITQAQEAAAMLDYELAGKVTNAVVSHLDSHYRDAIPTVEEVQDLVEEELQKNKAYSVAKRYILYRAERTKVREAKTKLMQSLHEITFKNAEEADSKRENANIDADTPMGTMLKYGTESSKAFYLSYVVDKRFSEAHLDGDIHIHDLDFYALTLTCCQIDLIKLFKNGFSTGDGYIREPNNIRSYASLACIAIQANQNDQHGGQSVPNFDYAMAEGVRKTYKKAFRKNLYKFTHFVNPSTTEDEIKNLCIAVDHETPITMEGVTYLESIRKILKDVSTIDNILDAAKINAVQETKDETFQAMEALIHNLNTMHSRAGAQVPFSSLNYGTDTSPEGRMVMHSLLDATLQGLGNGETPIFPIQIFKVKEGINYFPEDKNYDLFQKAILTSGKRLFPNFSFLDAPFNIKYYKPNDYNSEVVYMGCRTRVMANVADPEKEIASGRGNLSFTSINLPRIALKSNHNLALFYKELDEKLELVKDQLLERFEIQCRRKVFNFPFLMGQGVWLDSEKLGWEDEIRDVIRHGTLTIGFIGLAETLVGLVGHHHGESEEAQRLGLDIIGHMKSKCDEYSRIYKLNITLIATPAEGLSGRFVKIDQRIFGLIPGITDQEFYTNSFHIPVYFPITAFQKINIEAPYHALTNAGHISYVEVDGDVAKNPKAFEAIIRHMHDVGIGYGSVNHPIDRDPVCG